ncbi:caspase-1-A [Cherax quadricarinatus]|uniref:caspase-1-A n=1 Tax=Cherax quadricarinatus TaxID=27406 RepID=UPI00387EB1CA
MIHSSSRINIDDAVSRKEGPMHLVVQGANPLIQPSDHIYNTIMDPPGRVLILNYKNFNTDKLSTRKGSDHDVINLINLYSQMGYITEHHTDLTGDETRAVIKGFIKKQMVKHAGCLIIVVMSHGVDEGYSFYTTDKNMFAISDLRKNFTETEGLKSVPKLFFFQFCRGSAEPQAQIHTDGFQQSPENIIYFFATSKGFVSYRDPNSGAPFIKTWCKVLAEHSHRMNLEELYCEFKLQFESKSNGAKPEKESHDFSKKFYFNPRSEN